MFSVNVAIGNVSWALVYNNEEGARQAFNAIKTEHQFPGGPSLVVEDDYGQTLSIVPDKLVGLMLEDWNKTKLGHIERALHSQRTQLEAQKRWERDPAAQTRSLGLNQAGGQMPFVPLRN